MSKRPSFVVIVPQSEFEQRAFGPYRSFIRASRDSQAVDGYVLPIEPIDDLESAEDTRRKKVGGDAPAQDTPRVAPKYDLNDPSQHQAHLDILCGNDEEAIQELIKEIEKLPSWRHIVYMYPHTLKVRENGSRG